MKYKLTDQDYCTNSGMKWGEGVSHTAKGKGRELCTGDVIHYYTHPLLAVIFNPIHAGIDKPVLWTFRGRSVAFDGTKGGVKKGTTLKRIPLPVVTTEQRVRFAILCALEVCKDSQFKKWAEDWLSGKDRTRSAAWPVAESAARLVARSAARSVARSVAESAARLSAEKFISLAKRAVKDNRRGES